MDLSKQLNDLRMERDKLERVIQSLEELLAPQDAPSPGRRGRIGMGVEERKAVSLRMTRYWESRRAAKAAEVS